MEHNGEFYVDVVDVPERTDWDEPAPEVRQDEWNDFDSHCNDTCGGCDEGCIYCEETRREEAEALADERRDGVK